MNTVNYIATDSLDQNVECAFLVLVRDAETTADLERFSNAERALAVQQSTPRRDHQCDRDG